MKNKILLLLVSMLTTGLININAQGWVKKYCPDKVMAINSLYQLPDNNYLTSGFNTGGQKQRLMKIKPNGEVLWSMDYDSLSFFSTGNITQDGGYIFLGYPEDANQPTYTSRRLLRVDADGQKLWLKTIVNFQPAQISSAPANMDIDTTNNGGFVYAFNQVDPNQFNLLKIVCRLNADGDTIWQRSYFGVDSSVLLSSIRCTNDGGFIVSAYQYQASQSMIFKIDSAGNYLWQYSPSFPVTGVNAIMARDGNILITGSYYINGNTQTPASFVGKVSQTGHELWLRQFPLLSDTSAWSWLLIENNDNTFSAITSTGGNRPNCDYIKVDSTGAISAFHRLPLGNLGPNSQAITNGYRALVHTNDGGYAWGGWLYNDMDGYSAFLIKMDANGIVFPNAISGNTFYDINTNCQRDSGEMLLRQNLISFSSGSDTFNVLTDDSGYYSLGLDNATYNVSVTPYLHYTQPSACNVTQVTLNNVPDTTVSFGITPLTNAPYITVDGSTRQRPCAELSYTAQYCNRGTESFTGTMVITFDSLAVVDSASTPWFSHSNNVYSFSIADLPMNECGTLVMHYHLPCDLSLVGRTLCINADVYTDTVAQSSTGWDHSNLRVTANCDHANDSVTFTLKNLGTGGMGGSQKLIVIEDNVILLRLPVQLLAGQQYVFSQPANGSTWRASIAQTPDNPFSAFTTAAVEGCGQNQQGNYSTHYMLQFPFNGYYAFHYNTCSEVLNSMDPNEKTVTPTGVGPNHLVDVNTDLEYTIHFQNTGTDTAWFVDVLDTLAPNLNAATFNPGVSSHAYKAELLDNHIAVFHFYNIALPDSGHNQDGSNGYVKFRIKQKYNNPLGTVINNKAAIYFDYNPAVITNIATVTIGELLISDIQHLYNNPQVNINAYPNPFTDKTNIEVTGEGFEQLQLTVFDLSGRKVKEQSAYNSNHFTLNRNGFENGTYIFEIRTGNTLIGRGKILAQ